MNVYKDYRIYKDEDDKDKLKNFKDNAYKTRIRFIYNKHLKIRIIWLNVIINSYIVILIWII